MIPHTQLPTIATSLPFLRQIHNLTLAPSPTPPHPTIWKPLHNPSEWIYISGSLKTGRPRLGASVIHSATYTTSYIDASGLKETHTIMRAEFVAIYVALEKYKNDKWIGIFIRVGGCGGVYAWCSYSWFSFFDRPICVCPFVGVMKRFPYYWVGRGRNLC